MNPFIPVMKRHTSLVLLGTVIATAVGILSVSAFSATPLMVAQSTSITQESNPILGHVTYVIRDSDGDIKSYIQSDNLVTRRGKDCATTVMFRYNATSPCDANQSTGAGTSLTNGFNWIAIGNGTNAVADTDTVLPIGGTGGGEKQRLQSLPALTASTGGSATAVMSQTYSFTAGTATTIRNSGLFDASSSGNLFADQAINVPVSNGDSLTVTWTINMG